MRLWPLSVTFRMIASDTDEYREIRVGNRGLRHKSRHKIPHCRKASDCLGGYPPRPRIVNVPGRAQKKFKTFAIRASFVAREMFQVV